MPPPPRCPLHQRLWPCEPSLQQQRRQPEQRQPPWPSEASASRAAIQGLQRPLGDRPLTCLRLYQTSTRLSMPQRTRLQRAWPSRCPQLRSCSPRARTFPTWCASPRTHCGRAGDPEDWDRACSSSGAWTCRRGGSFSRYRGLVGHLLRHPAALAPARHTARPARVSPAASRSSSRAVARARPLRLPSGTS